MNFHKFSGTTLVVVVRDMRLSCYGIACWDEATDMVTHSTLGGFQQEHERAGRYWNSLKSVIASMSLYRIQSALHHQCESGTNYQQDDIKSTELDNCKLQNYSRCKMLGRRICPPAKLLLLRYVGSTSNGAYRIWQLFRIRSIECSFNHMWPITSVSIG